MTSLSVDGALEVRSRVLHDMKMFANVRAKSAVVLLFQLEKGRRRGWEGLGEFKFMVSAGDEGSLSTVDLGRWIRKPVS